MNNHKILIFLTLSMTVFIIVTANSQPFNNYFELFNYQYQIHLKVSDTTFEQGEETQMLRTAHIWAPRLYPYGSFNIASQSMYDYASGFKVDTSCTYKSPVPAHWKELGPFGNTTTTRAIGQIHRITFHPGYDGKSHKKVYACSGFGGLWNSDDSGENWRLMNTDNTLPFSGCADVAVTRNNNIFLATGYPDGTIYGTVEPNAATVNPLFTQGVYRSVDEGKNWIPINEGIGEEFRNGGVIRRILAEPDKGNTLVIATSRGIFYCNNSAGSFPFWKPGLLNGKKIEDAQLRGLEYKPGDPETIYAAGTDIYLSGDGGKTWKLSTGKNTGLDFQQLYSDYNGFQPSRINLAVTKANPEYLYAYIMGEQTEKKISAMFLFRYNGLKWEPITFHISKGVTDLYSQSYLGFAVSNVDPDMVYWGNTIIHGTNATQPFPSKVTTLMGYVTSGGGYVDIHALVFEPGSTNLFTGNHGGISVYDFTLSKWQYRNNGINNATIWSFDDNETEPDNIILALQDHGIRTQQLINDKLQWYSIGSGGDGYSARIYDDIKKSAYFSTGHGNIYNYDFNTLKKSIVASGFPPDNIEGGSPFFSKTFSCELHPNTFEPYVSFSEVYKRFQTDPKVKIQWQVESDIGKTIKPRWERQITELVISKSNPDIVYLSTMGVDNGTNPASRWHLIPRFFKSTTGFLNGKWEDAIQTFKEIELTNKSSGIPLLKEHIALPPVSGIAVHPLNPDIVWIAFTGFSKVHKVYRSNDGGKTWANEDPDECLHNLPVNGIMYQEGTNDRLYIATDAGVYTKDRDSQWQEFGDLPNVRVVEIKINYCNNSIKAATFGRGVFETELLTSSGPVSELIIRDDVEWKEDRFITGNIRILKGGSLTVHKMLFVPANGKIVVEKGGSLIVNTGTITNSCGKSWDGIYRQGKNSKVIIGNSSSVRNSIKNIVDLK